MLVLFRINKLSRGVALLLCVLAWMMSCSQRMDEVSLEDYEFVIVDSLVTDILQPIQVLDYHQEKELYLVVEKSKMEGHYLILDKHGDVVAENHLSEGPDAFGFVLVRAGFVGDEILLLSEQRAFIFDLNLKQKRSHPFEQKARFRLVHLAQDNLSTFRSQTGGIEALANLNDGFLRAYPLDYYDSIRLVHLIDAQTGKIRKGGQLDSARRFRSGRFVPFMDKPVYFSDGLSSSISTILHGDSILYQLDPDREFETVNRVVLPRIKPDQLIDLPMSEATYNLVNEYRGRNFRLGGKFDQLLGYGNELLVGYQTGADPSLYFEEPTLEQREMEASSRKRYYFSIMDGLLVSNPVEWTHPGRLWLNVGSNRFLQEGDQAELHEFEKDYQCFYIFSLEKTSK
jgi:hypothetical protein